LYRYKIEDRRRRGPEKGEIILQKEEGRFKAFVEEFNLLDPTSFGLVVDDSTSTA
jgi:hypothetical protein